jgi:hypothetical protein
MTNTAVSLSPLVFGLLITCLVDLRALARHGREKPANPDDSMPPAMAAASPAMIAAAAAIGPEPGDVEDDTERYSPAHAWAVTH